MLCLIYTDSMKAIRIFLLILILIGIGLLITQNVWVPSFVGWIMEHDGSSSVVIHANTTVATTTTKSTPPEPLPTHTQKGVVEGKVLLSPTCPVERIPPDPACAPRAYQTTIQIEPTKPLGSSISISSDASGAFKVSLNPGTYTFKPEGGASMLPTCPAMSVSVLANQTQTINLDCDTGIR